MPFTVTYTGPAAQSRCKAVSGMDPNADRTKEAAFQSMILPGGKQRKSCLRFAARPDVDLELQREILAEFNETKRQARLSNDELGIARAKEASGNELHHLLSLVDAAVYRQWCEGSTHLVSCLERDAKTTDVKQTSFKSASQKEKLLSLRRILHEDIESLYHYYGYQETMKSFVRLEPWKIIKGTQPAQQPMHSQTPHQKEASRQQAVSRG